MTPAEAVLMDLLLERGYTREQAARALVALTLPEPSAESLEWERGRVSMSPANLDALAGAFQAEAERLGYLPKP